MQNFAHFRAVALGLAFSATGLAGLAQAGPNDSDWISLFNGKDLNDWDIKFTGKQLNVNFNNTFKVTDSSLFVDYGGWGPWAGEFGHAAYKPKAFSHYLLRVEYQVGSTQVGSGPGWALQNNGLMLHSQSMASMTLNQDFPISMETQLLGASNTGADNNSTMNLCTPGTGFYTQASGGAVNTAHCYSAATNTRPAPNVWTWVSVSVMGDSIVRHYLGKSPTGTPTLTYYRPVYLKGNITNPPSNVPADGTKLDSGYISIQAESHPYKFRKIELLNLKGCATANNANYKAYFVKHDPAACSSTVGLGRHPSPPSLLREAFLLSGNRVEIKSGEAYSLQVLDMSGKVMETLRGEGPGSLALTPKNPGAYWVRLKTASGEFTRRVALL